MSAADQPNVDLASEIDNLRQEIVMLKESAAAEAASILERGKDAARSMKDTVTEKMRDGWEYTQDTIEERPLTAVLVAFGVGLLAGGWLLRRRG